MHMTIPSNQEWANAQNPANTVTPQLDEHGNPIPNPNSDEWDGKGVDWQKRYNDTLPESQYQNMALECAKDESKFLKFYESNRKWAERFAQEFWFDDAKALYDQLKERHGGAPKSGDDKPQKMEVNKDEVSKMVKQQLEAEKAKDSYEANLKKFKVNPSSEKWSKVIAEYEELIDGKPKTPENVNKFFQKAYQLVIGEDDWPVWITKTGNPLSSRAGSIGWKTPLGKIYGK